MSAKFPYLSKLGLLWKALTACAVLALALFPARPATSTTQLPQQSRAPAKSKVKVPQRPRLIRLVIPKRPYKASDYALPKDVSIRISGQRIVAVKTSPTRKDRHAWQALIGTRYHSGNVDGTDVSPQLWRKLTLLMHKADGSPLTLELLRPLWWLKRHRAAIGRSITLSLDEMGVRGKAILLKIAPCEADSRLLQAGEEIVTGKFVHVVQQVLHLSFEGSTKPLRVTPNHLLFAPERQAWIAAAQLRIGETLLRSNGQRHKLVARKLVRGTRKVYNLEVHRAHHYFVAQSKLLVHNSYFDGDDVALFKAPSPSRKNPGREVVDGFSPETYPGDGPYFSLDRKVAKSYQRHYDNGMQEIYLPKKDFKDLYDRGIIQIDPLERMSIHVPAKGLDEFNKAIKKGPPNYYTK